MTLNNLRNSVRSGGYNQYPIKSKIPTTRVKGKIWLKVTYVYILLIPLIDVLSVHPWFPIPMILGLILFAATLLYQKWVILTKEDSLLVFIVMLCMFPYVWSVPYLSYKTLNHLFAFIACLVIYYLVVKVWLMRLAIASGSSIAIFDALALSLLITSLYIIAEFTTRNFSAIKIEEFVFHTILRDYKATTAGGFVRARGFATESGTMALFYELASFLSYYSLKRFSWWVIGLFYSIVFVAYLFLFSSASFAAMTVVIALYMMRLIGQNTGAFIKRGIGILIIVGLALIFIGPYVIQFMEVTFFPKMALLWKSDLIGSSMKRKQVYEMIVESVRNYPFGIGWGVTAAIAEKGQHLNNVYIYGGQISLYGVFLVAGGIPAFVLFVIFTVVKLVKVFSLGRSGTPLLLAGVAMLLHLLFVSGYWFPFLWFYFAVIDIESRFGCAEHFGSLKRQRNSRCT